MYLNIISGGILLFVTIAIKASMLPVIKPVNKSHLNSLFLFCFSIFSRYYRLSTQISLMTLTKAIHRLFILIQVGTKQKDARSGVSYNFHSSFRGLVGYISLSVSQFSR